MKYIDRRGGEHEPFNTDIIRDRKGVWGVIMCDEHILVSWPPFAPDVADFPGGGMDMDEDCADVIMRETIEETGMVFEFGKAKKTFHQYVKFYAEVSDEYWNYDQTFWLYEFEGEDVDDEAWDTPEKGKSQWVKLDDIKSGKIALNNAHMQALKQLLKF